MKKWAILAAGAVLLMVTIPVFAAKPVDKPVGPAEKATGDVWFSTPWGTVNLTFNAHETDPAKGQVHWSRTAPSANWWYGPVIETNVLNEELAYFTVRVEDGTPAAVVGCDITFSVYDGGEPGIGMDEVEITAVVDQPTGDTCGADGQVQGPWTINAGNLQVHSPYSDYLYLYEKDPNDWTIVEDGAWGLLEYDNEGSEFCYDFDGYDLEIVEDYSLIYYADPWPGDKPGALIDSVITDGDGEINMMGCVDLGMDLPHPDDYNYTSPCAGDPCPGAKIWLVLSSDYDAGNHKMIGWDPTEYLFEGNTILYDDTDVP